MKKTAKTFSARTLTPQYLEIHRQNKPQLPSYHAAVPMLRLSLTLPLAAALSLLSISGIAPKPARAQASRTVTWLGRSGTAWSTGSNWDSNTAPDDATTALNFITGVTNTVAILDRDYRAYGITFNYNGARANTSFKISGNGSDNHLNLYGGGIVNNTALTQTIDAVVVLQAGQSFTTVAGGTLSFIPSQYNQIELQGNRLTVGGAGNTSIASPLIGSGVGGSLTKTGTGTLTLTGINSTFTGNLSINQGTLVAGASQTSYNPPASVLGSTNTAGRIITVGDGTNKATLDFVASQVFGTGNSNPQQTITVNQGSILTSSNSSFNILPTLTLSGGRLLASGGQSATQQAFAFAFGTVYVNGTSSSYILSDGPNSGYHLGGSTTFDVAVTGGGTDLTVFGKLVDNFDSNGAGSLVKTGNGTMILVSLGNTYTGSTTVNGGVLSVGSGMQPSNLGNKTGKVTINDGGTLTFGSFSEAGSAVISNNKGGTLNFTERSSADKATINNWGTMSFKDPFFGSPPIAGNATINNNSGGTVTFREDASADNATIINNSSVDFYNTSTAASATITNATFLSFYDASTADAATIRNNGVLFLNQHTGGLAVGDLSGSGNILLGNNALIVGGLNNSGTISGVLSGNGSLIKTGTGTLTLAGASTYTGGTTVNGGILSIGAGKNIGTGGLTLNGGVLQWTGSSETFGRTIALGSATGSTLDITNASTNLTIASVLSGSGSLTKTGTGTLIFTGLGSGLGSVNAPTDFNDGTTLLAGANSATYASLTASGGVNVGRNSGNNGTLTVSGTDGKGNATTLSTGPSSVGPYVGVYVGTAGVGTLNILGGGKVLSATDDYIGYFAGASGTVNVSGISTGADRLASLLDTSGGNLYVGYGGAGTLNISSGGVVTTGSGVTYLSSLGNATATLNLNGGTLTTDRIVVGNGATPTIRLSNSRFTLNVNGEPALTLGGNNGSTTLNMAIADAASGAGGIRKTGTGMLTLNGANTFSGGLQLEGGTLRLGNSLALQNSILLLNAGSVNLGALTSVTVGGLAGGQNLALTNAAATPSPIALTINSNGTATTYSGVLSGGGGLTLVGGSLTLTGLNTYTGGTMSNGTLNVGTAATAGSLGSGDVINNGSLSYNGNSSAGSANLSNRAGLYFTNSATAGSSSLYNEGGLYFNDSSSAGTATITNANGLVFNGNSSADKTIIRNTGILELRGHTGVISVGELSGTGNVSLGGNTLTVGGLDTNTTIDGVIDDSGLGGGLTKIGSGSLTLNGANTFTGAATISGGSIILGSASTLQNNTVVLNVDNGLNLNGFSAVTLGSLGGNGALALGNTSLTLRGEGASTYGGVISGSGALYKTGSVNVTLTGLNTYTGGTTTTGTLNVGSATQAGSLGSGPVENQGRLNFNGNSSAGSAIVTNGASLNFNDSASAGTSVITNRGEIVFRDNASADKATVINTAYFDISSHSGGLSVGALSGNGGFNLGSNALTVGGNNTNSAVEGSIFGGGSLTKTGTGILTLTGNNTYTGGTTISKGTLAAQGAGLGTGLVTVASSATLAVGEAVNTSGMSLTTHTLSLSSLVLNLGSATPLLTFNLGADGISDLLYLTGSSSALTTLGSGELVVGFGSATGGTLGAGSYTLMSFGTPQSSSSLPSIFSYKAAPAGNVNGLRTGGATSNGFSYLTNGNGQITGLGFTVASVETPEPNSLLLLLCTPLTAVWLVRRRRANV